MKMSTGGIGAVATSQACNAKSAYPYQWAWNAVGSDSSNFNLNNTTAVSDPRGVKVAAVAAAGAYGTYAEYKDEAGTPPGGNRSGPLTVEDVIRAPYVHCVVDLRGFDGTGDYEGQFFNADYALNNFVLADPYGSDGGGVEKGTLVYGTTDSHATHKTKLAGGVALYEQPDGTHVFVWNARDQIPMNSATNIWNENMPTEAPITLGLMIGSEFLEPLVFPVVSRLGGDLTNYFIYCGFVLSDRILTDIPLPIRTHMG